MHVCVAWPPLRRSFFSWRSLSGRNVAAGEATVEAGLGVVTPVAALVAAMSVDSVAATWVAVSSVALVAFQALGWADSPADRSIVRPSIVPDLGAVSLAGPSCITVTTEFASAQHLAFATTIAGASTAIGGGVGVGRGGDGDGVTIRRLMTMTTTRTWQPLPR